MPDLLALRWIARQYQHVESVLVAGAAAFENPGPGHPFQDAALLGPNGLLTGSEAIRASGLHLDEGNEIAPPGDEIEVVVAEAPPMCLNAPAATADEPPTGSDFRLQAVAMAWIGPGSWWYRGD